MLHGRRLTIDSWHWVIIYYLYHMAYGSIIKVFVFNLCFWRLSFSTGLWVQNGGSIEGFSSPFLLLWSELWVRTCWFLYKPSILYFSMLLDLSQSAADCEPTLPHLPFEVTHQSSPVRVRRSYESVVCPHSPSSFNLCNAIFYTYKEISFRFQIWYICSPRFKRYFIFNYFSKYRFLKSFIRLSYTFSACLFWFRSGPWAPHTSK